MRFPIVLAAVAAATAGSVVAFPFCENDANAVSEVKVYGNQNSALGYQLTIKEGTPPFDPNTPIEILLDGAGMQFSSLQLYVSDSRYSKNHTGKWVDFGSEYTLLDGAQTTPPTANTKFGAADNAGCEKYGKGATLSTTSVDAKKLPAKFHWLPPPNQPAGSLTIWGLVVQDQANGFKVVSAGPISAANPYPAVKSDAATVSVGAAAIVSLVAGVALMSMF
ncbi:uncharacterized protein EV422DRAFT_48596 [Fimicolochytrium jonesii]|uniref:uncharacterized protein n=1 Tax=Fimicolochytrium jonesii TaxID=1396493 RepID=UPI0022FE8027|nr:uncharacterized protein EV422DRAFT_48596 [Fimicolochytrium jonesii]KAI8820993.1 hypothetical protein EV422DRAFT_48596 [Fimicolochytrium jonesii]